MNKKNINLTASEIGTLWTEYMNNSMSKQILGFMLQHIKDGEIKPIIRKAYNHSAHREQALISIFKNEQYATPIGFADQDVNMDAPRLFTDTFCLTYANHMARVGMIVYSGFLAVSYRKDIINHFSDGLEDITKLYKESLSTSLQKGINPRHPHIEVPKETEFIESKNYYSGLSPFNEKRPLNAVEISHLYLNIMTNSLGFKLCLAFAQTTHSKEVQDFMLRAKEISQKHNKLFSDTLMKDDIESPHIPDVVITDSTTQTFTDKLMMFHISLLMSAGMGNYATAAAASQRNDLALNYERLSLEVSRLAKSGADIMIKNNYLEQPPGTTNREKLAKENQEKS